MSKIRGYRPWAIHHEVNGQRLDCPRSGFKGKLSNYRGSQLRGHRSKFKGHRPQEHSQRSNFRGQSQVRGHCQIILILFF